MSKKGIWCKQVKELVPLVLLVLPLDPIYTGVFMFTGYLLTQDPGDLKNLSRAFKILMKFFAPDLISCCFEERLWQGVPIRAATGKHTPTS
jgi:hypothetical protein